jgi:protein-S-isoprenylcysteine O-methyltransferase Ste14
LQQAPTRVRIVAVVMLGIADIISFALYAVIAGLAVAADLQDPVWFVALGASLVFAALWVAARLQLGAAFSVRPEAHELVRTGFYARLRHPVYVFGTPAFILALGALGGWKMLLLWTVILVPVQIVRARREERVLAEAFGTDYEAYRGATWF